jgi:uncharacterized protein
MAGLLLIGAIHITFFWLGDILTLYALLGFVLLAFQNTSNRNLIRWAVALLILPILHWGIMHFTGFYYPFALFDLHNQYVSELGMPLTDWDGSGFLSMDPKEEVAIDSFWLLIQVNIGGPLIRLALLLLEGRIFKVLALFLIGIWAGRNILQKDLLANRSFLFKVMLWGFCIGIPANLLRADFVLDQFTGTLNTFLDYLFYALGVVPLALAYSAGIALIVLDRPMLLGFFAPVGRMALSNYLFQTLISIAIYYGVGLNLAGTIGYTKVVLISLAIFTWQVIFSTLWLRYFRFGPVEWIWRQMTYGKYIPNRRIQGIELEPKAILSSQKSRDL